MGQKFALADKVNGYARLNLEWYKKQACSGLRVFDGRDGISSKFGVLQAQDFSALIIRTRKGVRRLLDSNDVPASLSGSVHLGRRDAWYSRRRPSGQCNNSRSMQNHLIAPNNLLTIAEMAAFGSVSYRTLRFYEDRGLLQPDRVGQTRFYSHRDRVRLEMIMKGKRLGFSLRQIERLIKEPSAASSDVVSKLTSDELMRQINQLAERREDVQTALGELTAALAGKGQERT